MSSVEESRSESRITATIPEEEVAPARRIRKRPVADEAISEEEEDAPAKTVVRRKRPVAEELEEPIDEEAPAKALGRRRGAVVAEVDEEEEEVAPARKKRPVAAADE